MGLQGGRGRATAAHRRRVGEGEGSLIAFKGRRGRGLLAASRSRGL